MVQDFNIRSSNHSERLISQGNRGCNYNPLFLPSCNCVTSARQTQGGKITSNVSSCLLLLGHVRCSRVFGHVSVSRLCIVYSGRVPSPQFVCRVFITCYKVFLYRVLCHEVVCSILTSMNRLSRLRTVLPDHIRCSHLQSSHVQCPNVMTFYCAAICKMFSRYCMLH